MEIKLSVVIITFNEEKNIERCLQSVQKVADEVIVVDSFSTDKTRELCLAYNVKFIENSFEGHIQQKNYAKDQASFNYVLSLDADEALSDNLTKEILKIKKNCTKDGYYFNRLNNYCGKWIKHGSWYPDRKLRLFHKNRGEWTGENPHDEFVTHKSNTAKRVDADILHYSFYSVFEHLQQINKFTELAAEAALSKGKRSSIIKIIFNPKAKFLKDYVLKLGFLDGFYGFVIAVNSTWYTFTKYVKMYIKQS